MKSKQNAHYLIEMINRYKKGDVTKEKFYEILETFVSVTDLKYDGNQELKYVMENLIPDICWFYVEEPGEWKEKEEGFKKEILVCEEIVKNI